MIYLENKYFNLISAYANYFFWLLSLAKTKLICDWTMQSVVGWEGYFFFFNQRTRTSVQGVIKCLYWGVGCAILFYSVYDKFNIFVCHKQSKKLSKMKVNFHRNRKNTNYLLICCQRKQQHWLCNYRLYNIVRSEPPGWS